MMSSRFQKRAVGDIQRIIADIKPDMIHAHGTRAAFFLAKGREANRETPAIYTVHGLSYNKDVNLFKRVFYRQIERYICEKLDKVIADSEHDGQEMLENEIVAGGKLRIIKNGIDLKELMKLPTGRKDTEPLGTIARLVPQKGIYYLIKALSILKNHFALTPRLIIVGDGPLRRALEKKGAKLGVADQIEWVGSVTDPLEYYKKFGAFILPSLWEGLPLTMLEAMASGLPLISTDTSGALDVIEDEVDGLIVRRLKSRELAAAILRLMQDKKLAIKLAAAGRKKVFKEYGLDKFLEATGKTYKEIL
jgi:glycosyltransferase involved in cell wall biosynthesis